MQANCSKCSRPIALTDTIESNNARLSHVDCQRPHVLTGVERALTHVYCSGHVVARCPVCDISYRYTELAGDMVGDSRTNMCPRCHRDLSEAVRAHLVRCAMLPSEVRRRAQDVREAAQQLVKETRQLRDRSDVLIREAEAMLADRQRALREAMSRRAASVTRRSPLGDEPIRYFDCTNCGASVLVPVLLLTWYSGQTVTRWCRVCRRLIDLRISDRGADRS